MGKNDIKERPPESWRRAFEEQATEEAMASVYTYAASLARMIENATRRRDPLIAREMVLDAMADTFAGVVTWDPDRAPLAAHLCRVLRSRTSHELERTKNFVHVSLDDRDSPSHRSLETATSEAMEANEAVEEHACAARARDVVAGIRRLAAADPPVLQLLDAFEQGATERHDIMQVTGMTSGTYHNARRRLVRLASKLPDDVRDAVAQVMA